MGQIGNGLNSQIAFLHVAASFFIIHFKHKWDKKYDLFIIFFFFTNLHSERAIFSFPSFYRTFGRNGNFRVTASCGTSTRAHVQTLFVKKCPPKMVYDIFIIYKFWATRTGVSLQNGRHSVGLLHGVCPYPGTCVIFSRRRCTNRWSA